MITIKTGSYSKDEVKQLATLFEKLEKLMLLSFCDDNKCNICPYKHICEDIHNAKVFITDRANKHN